MEKEISRGLARIVIKNNSNVVNVLNLEDNMYYQVRDATLEEIERYFEKGFEMYYKGTYVRVKKEE